MGINMEAALFKRGESKKQKAKNKDLAEGRRVKDEGFCLSILLNTFLYGYRIAIYQM